MKQSPIACFCMEIALDAGMPTYSGGLGVLAGDMIRSPADFQIPNKRHWTNQVLIEAFHA